jgi:hypothetical protein
MKYLETPFEGNVTIQIQNGRRKDYIDCELATSEIEIFQSASFRKPNQFKRPLVLKFSNPLVQTFCLQQFQFDTIQVLVDTEYLVKRASFLPKYKSGGSFIQCYSGFSMVIFFNATSNFAKQIMEGRSRISIS